ncbi:enterobactin esterase [Buttiauxella ferragutiae ATCC 51602]|uniref:Enterobactin esterase n=1 Tax=Buttiauxella ferragutiae ATCC 51602 TaxID=1354252 RepID=A0ABX2W2C3_9ENTR|nr:enterochelin esterase [Buttiauxella ferragutiae]OAT24648.1 enterobactin esterase [Buttiauxella ferragutiae ATCC 51602]
MRNILTGSEGWWQQRLAHGIPAVSGEKDGQCTVTFLWRDPQGSEQTSAIKRVWIYITGVTDHHQRARPQTLERVAGTDVWLWETQLSSTWRGSYCFIPSSCEEDFPAAAFEGIVPEPMALREGWRKLLPCAIADPLNPESWHGGRGHPMSALHLPDAPPQPGWQALEIPYREPQCITWNSPRLHNQRRVWIFTTGDESPEQRPLAILLDGQFWAEGMPVWSALQAQTDSGELPPAVYVLIDVIDDATRSDELPCNAQFWCAVQEELLPQLRAQIRWNENPETTVVAGQSYGGLSSLYAALHWPEQFGCVLSQSGSYWWPKRETAAHGGQLIQQLESGWRCAKPLRIYLEAGVREPLIHQVNQRIYPLLQQTQQPIFYRQVDGGHDALCWRGGLLDGLTWLWKASFKQE